VKKSTLINGTIFLIIFSCSFSFAEETENQFVSKFKKMHTTNEEKIVKNFENNIFEVEKTVDKKKENKIYFTDGQKTIFKVVTVDIYHSSKTSNDKSKFAVCEHVSNRRDKEKHDIVSIYSSGGDLLLKTNVRKLGEIEISNTGEFVMDGWDEPSEEIEERSRLVFYDKNGKEIKRMDRIFYIKKVIKYSPDGRILFLAGSPMDGHKIQSLELIAFNLLGDEIWHKVMDDFFPVKLITYIELVVYPDRVEISGWEKTTDKEKIIQHRLKIIKRVFDYQGNLLEK
jgi:hypothetical protein